MTLKPYIAEEIELAITEPRMFILSAPAARHGHDAVIDPRLKVHGVRSLCVADASIMPQVVGDNTNSPRS